MKRAIKIASLALFLFTGTAFAYKIECVSKDNIYSKTYTVVDVKEQITFKGVRLEVNMTQFMPVGFILAVGITKMTLVIVQIVQRTPRHLLNRFMKSS